VSENAAIRTASSEVVRDINRRIVLNLIRTRQPISRADLSRASGMQRSTISLIVEELISENWLIEGPAVKLPRGRRPTFLRLNEERAIIGVDIRPSQTTIALADVNGKFGPVDAFPTPRHAEAGIREIVSRIGNLIERGNGRKMEGIGIALPGRYDQTPGKLVFAPNLGWRDVDLRTPIAEATGLEVELENAANACALAAVWFDHVESFRNVVAVTVSEGIGTGILVNGQLACGLGGMAGEFGHVSLDPDGPLCSCGSRGCWEVFGSNRAAVRYYREAMGDVPGEARAIPADLAGVTFLDLLARAEAGDNHATGALERMAHQLGRGMRIIVAGLAPERILVIGDLTRSWHLFGPLLEADVAAQVLPGGQTPHLVAVHEDGMARLRGTVALVLRKHFSPAM
jgi:predicted NBD/HSP70 family sugar kinase